MFPGSDSFDLNSQSSPGTSTNEILPRQPENSVVQSDWPERSAYGAGHGVGMPSQQLSEPTISDSINANGKPRGKLDKVSDRNITAVVPSSRIQEQTIHSRSAADLLWRRQSDPLSSGRASPAIEPNIQTNLFLVPRKHQKLRPILSDDDLAELSYLPRTVTASTQKYRNILSKVKGISPEHVHNALSEICKYYEALLTEKHELDQIVDQLSPKLIKTSSYAARLERTNQKLSADVTSRENQISKILYTVNSLEHEKEALNGQLRSVRESRNENFRQHIVADNIIEDQCAKLQKDTKQLRAEAENLRTKTSSLEEKLRENEGLFAATQEHFDLLFGELIVNFGAISTLDLQKKVSNNPEPGKASEKLENSIPDSSTSMQRNESATIEQDPESASGEHLLLSALSLATNGSPITNEAGHTLSQSSTSILSQPNEFAIAVEHPQYESVVHQHSGIPVTIDNEAVLEEGSKVYVKSQINEFFEKPDVSQHEQFKLSPWLHDLGQALENQNLNENELAERLQLENFELDNSLNVGQSEFYADNERSPSCLHTPDQSSEQRTNGFQGEDNHRPRITGSQNRVRANLVPNPLVSNKPYQFRSTLGSSMCRLPSIPEFAPLQTSILHAELISTRYSSYLSAADNQLQSLLQQDSETQQQNPQHSLIPSRPNKLAKLWCPPEKLIESASNAITSSTIPSSTQLDPNTPSPTIYAQECANKVNLEEDSVSKSHVFDVSFERLLLPQSHSYLPTSPQQAKKEKELEAILHSQSQSDINVADWISKIQHGENYSLGHRPSKESEIISDAVRNQSSAIVNRRPTRSASSQSAAGIESVYKSEDAASCSDVGQQTSIDRSVRSSQISPKSRLPRRIPFPASPPPQPTSKKDVDIMSLHSAPAVSSTFGGSSWSRRRPSPSHIPRHPRISKTKDAATGMKNRSSHSLQQSMFGGASPRDDRGTQADEVGSRALPSTNSITSRHHIRASDRKRPTALEIADSNYRKLLRSTSGDRIIIPSLPSWTSSTKLTTPEYSGHDEDLMRDIELLVCAYGEHSVLNRLSQRLSVEHRAASRKSAAADHEMRARSSSQSPSKAIDISTRVEQQKQHSADQEEELRSIEDVPASDGNRNHSLSNDQLPRDVLERYRPVSVVESLSSSSRGIPHDKLRSLPLEAANSQPSIMHDDDEAVMLTVPDNADLYYEAAAAQSVPTSSATSTKKHAGVRVNRPIVVSVACQTEIVGREPKVSYLPGPVQLKALVQLAFLAQFWVAFLSWIHMLELQLHKLWDCLFQAVDAVSTILYHRLATINIRTTLHHCSQYHLAAMKNCFPTGPLIPYMTTCELFVQLNKYATLQTIFLTWWALMTWLLLATFALKSQWEYGNSVRARREVPYWRSEYWMFDPAASLKGSVLHFMDPHVEPVSYFT